jgi:ribulose 1,5-bisphosphate synthetase/thiazole synthase
VAYHERGLGPGNLLRHAAWVRWAFWALLVAVVGALVAAVIVHVSPTVTGPLRVDPVTGQTSVLVAASGHSTLGPGLVVTIADGRRGRVGEVQRANATDALGGAELIVQVSLEGPGRATFGTATTATIHLPRRRFAVFVFPGLRGLLGD